MHKNKIGLATISGILFAFAWNSWLPSFSLFIAFVPLFFVFEDKTTPGFRMFHLSFLTFMVFHLGTVWWLYKSSILGFIAIICLNSAYFSLAITAAFWVRKKTGMLPGLMAFVSFWISFEFIHYHWALSWPFMNLGNWLGQVHQIIQWYQYTGILGGSLWILVVNCLLYFLIQSMIERDKRIALISIILILLIVSIPVLISKSLYQKDDNSSSHLNFKVIQPNIDPYHEKYETQLYKDHIDKQLNEIRVLDSEKIYAVIFPESSFPVYLNEDSTNQSDFFQRIDSSLLRSDNQFVIGGLYSFRKINSDTLFYNTAFYYSNKGVQLRHKSRLVIGVEKMPFDNYFRFLKSWNIDLGGYNNSLSSDNEAINFSLPDTALKIAPIVCYESVYGNYIAQFVLKGATCIAVITNDAWWGNTPGYHQHLMHSQLRAIETGRSVVRSANTGISCIINSRGDIIKQIEPFKTLSFTGKLQQNKDLTFYCRYGDFIGFWASILSILILIATIYKSFFNRDYNRH